jgi:hypothetical protein
MPKLQIQKSAAGEISGASPATDNRPPLTPSQLAKRWSLHPESTRRILRERRIASIIIGRRRYIPASEVARLENEGFIARAN